MFYPFLSLLTFPSTGKLPRHKASDYFLENEAPYITIFVRTISQRVKEMLVIVRDFDTIY